jgi:hypothetical protein
MVLLLFKCAYLAGRIAIRSCAHPLIRAEQVVFARKFGNVTKQGANYVVKMIEGG